MSGDWCTNDGARKIKDKIEAYWRDKGYDVDIDLVDGGFVAAMRSGRTDVRSDMINGMPTKRETSSSDTLRMNPSSMKPSKEAGSFNWLR